MPSSPFSPTRSPGVLPELFAGRLRWDLLRPAPDPDPEQVRAANDAVGRLATVLRARVRPEQVEAEGRLPDGLLDALQEEGLLRLMVGPELGGLGLTPHAALRVVEAAAAWSTPVAFVLAVGNGFGSGSYLPALREGPLRDLIAGRVRSGIVSGGADAEAIGTANARRATTAVPVDGGRAYRVSGEKVYIGNGPVADLLDVSVTVIGPDGPQVRLLFVDTTSPGFTVSARHEFMGLRGAEIGSLRLDSVQVPAENLMPQDADGWRMRPDGDRTPGPAPAGQPADPGESAERADLGRLALVARTLVIAGPALALAKVCLLSARDFVRRREVDGVNLGDYDEIRHNVAETAADVFAIESLADWGLLGHDRADTAADLTAIKNLTSLACWRAADRTVSLLGAEGYETAASKARRGVPALPVERCLRDARALRVAGGVDFMLDLWTAKDVRPQEDPGGGPDPAGTPTDPVLQPRCADHLAFVAAQARALAARHRIGRDTGDPGAAQRTGVLLGRIGAELLGMSVVLARAAQRAEQGDPGAQVLADIWCSGARPRLAAAWSELNAPDEPDHAGVTMAWLAGDDLAGLVGPAVEGLATEAVALARAPGTAGPAPGPDGTRPEPHPFETTGALR